MNNLLYDYAISSHFGLGMNNNSSLNGGIGIVKQTRRKGGAVSTKDEVVRLLKYVSTGPTKGNIERQTQW